MSQNLRELNLEDAASLLKEAAVEQRWAHGRISELETKVAEHERFRHALNISQNTPEHMREGLGVVDFATKLAASQENLAVWEKAAQMQSTQLPKLASVSEDNSLTGFNGHVDSPSQIPEGHASQAMQNWLLTSYSGNAGLLNGG